jgi:hypothetical protein
MNEGEPVPEISAGKLSLCNLRRHTKGRDLVIVECLKFHDSGNSETIEFRAVPYEMGLANARLRDTSFLYARAGTEPALQLESFRKNRVRFRIIS